MKALLIVMEYIGVQTMLVCFYSVSDTLGKSHEKNLIEDRIIISVNFLAQYTTCLANIFLQEGCSSNSAGRLIIEVIVF